MLIMVKTRSWFDLLGTERATFVSREKMKIEEDETRERERERETNINWAMKI